MRAWHRGEAQTEKNEGERQNTIYLEKRRAERKKRTCRGFFFPSNTARQAIRLIDLLIKKLYRRGGEGLLF